MHPSARRHGDHSLVVDDLGEDPDRWLVIGPIVPPTCSNSSSSSALSAIS